MSVFVCGFVVVLTVRRFGECSSVFGVRFSYGCSKPYDVILPFARGRNVSKESGRSSSSSGDVHGCENVDVLPTTPFFL